MEAELLLPCTHNSPPVLGELSFSVVFELGVGEPVVEHGDVACSVDGRT